MKRLAHLAWRDTWATPARLFLLAAGVAVGVAALALFFAVGRGVESAVMHRVLGVLPDRLVVEPSATAIGPIKMGGAPLDDAAIERIRAIPGVRGVLRRMQIPLPAHLTANIQGRSFYTDLIVEAVDPEVVEGDVPPGSFAVRPLDQPMPSVLPSVMLDILNIGLAVNTGLPQMNPDVIVGRHFTLNLGSSSFKIGPTASMRSEVVGISPRIGVGGPAIPIGYLPELDRMLREKGGEMPRLGASSATVQLNSPEDAPAVTAVLKGQGLTLPQEGRVAQVGGAIRAVSLAMTLFGLLVLAVAGTGIGNGLGLMVKDESGEIGLFRAIGASQADVLSLYLLRAAFVGMVGGACGVLIAALAAITINSVAARALPGLLSGDERMAALAAADVALALGLGMLFSVLAGVIPARQAARIDPAAALRER
ncbi:MAG: FtsX-like permease family protein [Armatimonadetes bacterium]|nr:FtsX-like permease family protein [Armatimonadota bacterium]